MYAPSLAHAYAKAGDTAAAARVLDRAITIAAESNVPPCYRLRDLAAYAGAAVELGLLDIASRTLALSAVMNDFSASLQDVDCSYPPQDLISSWAHFAVKALNAGDRAKGQAAFQIALTLVARLGEAEAAGNVAKVALALGGSAR